MRSIATIRNTTNKRATPKCDEMEPMMMDGPNTYRTMTAMIKSNIMVPWTHTTELSSIKTIVQREQSTRQRSILIDERKITVQ